MRKIDVDKEVYDKIGEIAIPFIETTPNMVLRRVLGLAVEEKLSSDETGDVNQRGINNRIITSPSLTDNTTDIEKLREVSLQTRPAVLTFLMDKFHNTKGNYKISDIMVFMEKVHLSSSGNHFRNPWMKTVYRGEKNGLISCQRTIEHFRQTRKFGCWSGRDNKSMCDNLECQYHPNNEVKMQNKCDFRFGIIWKRNSPNSAYSYGTNYLEVVKKELLRSRTIPLRPLLKVFYPDNIYNDELINQFVKDFHLSPDESRVLFSQ